uniref:Uncharacterized protein n=1 Tax=viral metagenome TaxID=1070528 RepID=A0A6M3IM92_9ZZZZ
MRVISFIILFLLITVNALAIPIYCPECKTHLYDYEKEVIPNATVYAKDFKPMEGIPQPKETDPMDCPICKCTLNGWEFMGRRYKSFTNIMGALSLLTKDELGFKWVPWDVPDTEYTRE